MIRIVKNVFYLLLASVMLALIIFLPLTIYGIRQLTGQLRISVNAVSISEYVTAHSADTIYTPKLKYLEEVRAFAMDSLGLHSSDNYTTFYDHGSKPLMWVVTACKPYSLEPASWWFPFLGSVTYKGFFDESLAAEEARVWQQNGYETDIYNPSAWSTLGFLHDPVLSGMLQRGPGSLAELIIHELTHATIFVSGDIDYNENIATFIGEQGAVAFLEMHFGKSSPEVERYTNRLLDQDVYARHMLHGAQRLDSLYRTLSSNMPDSEKAAKKFRLISEIMLGINFLPLKEPELYRFDFRNRELPKNPDFMAYIRYRKDQSDLRERWSTEFQGDLRKMIRTLDSEGGIK